MSVYATQADMTRIFGAPELLQLTDPNAEAPDAQKIAEALAQASDIAESYIRQKYALPLSAYPPALVAAVCDIARYVLHTEEIPKTVQTRYEARIDWLKRIARGDADLGLAVDTPAAPPNAVLGVKGTQAIGRDALAGYVRGGV